MVSSTNTIVIVTPGLKQCYVSTAGGGGGTKEDLSGFPFFIWHSGLKMEKNSEITHMVASLQHIEENSIFKS